MNIQLTNFFTDQLPADPNLENTRREVLEAVYSFVRPIKTSNPILLHVSDEIQQILGFTNEDIQSKEFLEFVILIFNHFEYLENFGVEDFNFKKNAQEMNYIMNKKFFWWIPSRFN